MWYVEEQIAGGHGELVIEGEVKGSGARSHKTKVFNLGVTDILITSLLVATVQCIVDYLAASLAPIH